MTWPQPSITTQQPVWVIADLHGSLALTTEIFKHIGNDPFVQLGDLIDRGPKSKQVAELFLNAQQQGQGVLISGNHEQMMRLDLYGDSSWDWYNQGGKETLQSCENLQDAYELIKRLSEVQKGALLSQDIDFGVHGTGELLLSHAMRPADPAQTSPWGETFALELFGRPDSDHQPSWEESCKKFQTEPTQAKLKLSVHGHTIMQAPTLIKESDGSFSLYLDLGSSFALKRRGIERAALLHTPTLEVHTLILKEENPEPIQWQRTPLEFNT